MLTLFFSAMTVDGHQGLLSSKKEQKYTLKVVHMTPALLKLIEN